MLFSVIFLTVSGLIDTAAANQQPVLLTINIEGDDGREDKIVTFTRSDLMALPAVTFETSTNWTAGTPHFTGVALRSLLDPLDVTDGEIELIAINHYSVFLPLDDPTSDGAMLAYLMNGKPMSARGKGPLWLVYDYDSDRKFRTESVYSRSVWQLDRIIISR
ncbi:molybdopterin-dependent oxidoreductase [Roseovarius sp. CAU 1744]|uniref:molybdopterin-dependent oxidoreductase n=1 Tax=Roseovarius sp. CAU 1744 TaxID=3140368 RepID=UPI00325BC108